MNKFKVSQVKMGAFISYFALGISIITGLLYTPWMVRQIGQSNYGLYSLATSLISIFMLDFGLGSAVSRFISKYRAEGNQQAANQIIGVIYKLYIIIDIVILAILVGVFFFLGGIYKKLTPSELVKFKQLYIMVAGFNLISFPLSPLNGILNSYEKFIQLKSCDLFHKLSTVAFVIIALNVSSDVSLVVGANILSGLATIAIKWIIVKTSIPLRVDFRGGDKSFYKSLFGFTAWTTVNSIMHRFTHSFAPSVLGMTASSIEIALYSPAVVLEGYFYLVATAVNGLFLPRISRFIAEKRENEILKLMIKVGRYQITMLGLLFVGFVCVGKEFMVLWMGPEYLKSYYCTVILIFPSVISYSQQIGTTTVIAKNLIKYSAISHIFTGVLGLGISYVTSIYWGAIGVCIGTGITMLLNAGYMQIIYYTKAGINVFEFYKKTYLKAFPCYALVILFSMMLTRFIALGGWFGLISKAFVVGIVYLIVFGFVYFSSEDRKSLLRRLKIIK